MANDLNVVALVGRLTRPCDMRYTNSGFAICSFSIAVNRRRKQTDGTWQDQASFFDCSYFGKAAEGVSQYLQKGQQIGVQGSLEQQTWDDKATGQKRSKIAVIVDSLTLLGSSNGSGSRAPQQNAGGFQQSRQNNGYSNQSNGNYANQQQFGSTQAGTGNSNGGVNNSNSGAASNPQPASSVVKPSTPAPSNVGPEDFDDDNIPF
jgi:single-strand DNA-binding protein